MKKKVLSMLLALTMSAALLVGCGSSEGSSQSSSTSTASDSTASDSTSASAESASTGGLLDSIKAAGKLVVGTASGYPPYEFVDVTSSNQDVIGIDIALAQAIADELGVELVVQDMNFSALLSSLPAHKIDLAIAGINPTDERKKTLDFSDSYLTAENKIIINKADAETYKTLEDFKGQPLAVEKSTTQETVCQELFPDSPLTSLERVPDCILELKNGKAVGVVVENIVGEQYLMSDDTLQFSDADLDRDKESAVALEKGNEDLLEIINKVIKENQDNGNFDKWVEEYSQKSAESAG